MLILIFWPTYPLFAKRIFLGLGNPVRESGTPAYLRSLKMLPIDFSSQKTYRAKFLGHFDSQFRIYGHFQVFSKKFQRSIFRFRVFAVPVSRNFYLLLQFSRYRDAVCGIIRTTKLATKHRKRNFEFLPQKFFRAFQSQIFFFQNFF